MGVSPRLVGHHIEVDELRIDDMVHRGQHNALPHGLDAQGRLDGPRGAQGVAHLGFVGGDGDPFEQRAEYAAQAFDFDRIPLGRGGAVGIDMPDILGCSPASSMAPSMARTMVCLWGSVK
jgi:hypothetical protein